VKAAYVCPLCARPVFVAVKHDCKRGGLRDLAEDG
jgi:hypothetical protein